MALWIDTDCGVDDALALGFLLRMRHDIIGISAVFGNTSVENAARNVLTVQAVAETSIPVAVGAATPLYKSFSFVPAFVHGPDGLWFAQQPHDLTTLDADAPAAIAQAAHQHPDLTLLALGPMTNVAEAYRRFPEAMASVQVIALAGAQRHGNRSQVAESNVFSDPEALSQLLAAHPKLQLLTLNAFDQPLFDLQLLEQMQQSGDPLWGFLAPPLKIYAEAQVRAGTHTNGQFTIPDLVAAALVLFPNLAVPASALVKVVHDGLGRGETLIATEPNQKAQIIADDPELSALVQRVFSDPAFEFNGALGAILVRERDNADVILALEYPEQLPRLLTYLFGKGQFSPADWQEGLVSFGLVPSEQPAL